MSDQTTTNPTIDLSTYLENGIDFEHYLQTFSESVEKIKAGEGEGIFNADYFPLNYQRLKRGLKQIVLTPELATLAARIEKPIKWLVITEFWCGDAAQSLALLQHVAQASEGKIELKLAFRDENPELMNAFLTNGSKSIPKVIQLNDRLEVIGTWGPRPEAAQQLVQGLLNRGESYNDDLHKWYAQDKGQHLQKEIAVFLKSA